MAGPWSFLAAVFLFAASRQVDSPATKNLPSPQERLGINQLSQGIIFLRLPGIGVNAPISDKGR